MNRVDTQLVQRMADGDAQAFEAFYDLYAPTVLALLRQLVGHPGDAEDVLQETFWQAWRKAGQYDALRASPLGWLLMMARSRAMDLLRRRRPHAEFDHATAPEPASAECTCALERAEMTATVRSALAQLPKEQAQALRLCFFGGLSHEEVARAAGIPLGTAKTRIRLGMHRLRELLREIPEVAT